MPAFEQISRGIWDDEDFAELGRSAKYLYMWAIVNTHLSPTGIYKATPRTMAHETSMSAGEVERALVELEAAGALERDAGRIFLVSRVKHMKLSPGDNRVTSVVRDLAGLPPSNPLRRSWLGRYGDAAAFAGLLDEIAAETQAACEISEDGKTEGASKGLPSPRIVLSSSSTTSRDRPTARAREAADDELPADLDPVIAERVPVVAEILRGAIARRGGHDFALHSLASAMADFPDRDHVGEARDAVDWMLNTAKGRQRTRPRWRDFYRNWLRRADPAPRAPTATSGDDAGWSAYDRRIVEA